MKTFKLICNCLLGFIIVVLLLILFFTFINRGNDIPKIGNYSLLEVKGTSMNPDIKNGDLIVIDRRVKNNYEIGDIVSFRVEDGSIITHKIIEIEKKNGINKYFTKGVNNNYQDNDYIEIKQIIGEYKNIRIPLIGYVIGFANTRLGYILLVIIPMGLLFVLAMRELLKEVLKKRGEC